jgi:hypothetical protein
MRDGLVNSSRSLVLWQRRVRDAITPQDSVKLLRAEQRSPVLVIACRHKVAKFM